MSTAAHRSTEAAVAVPAERPGSVTVELTDGGDLRMSADVAARFFPSDALVALARGGELWLVPLIGPQGGGLLLKQRNLAGDRSALVWEALPPGAATGQRPGRWDDQAGALRIDVRGPAGTDGFESGADSTSVRQS